MRNAEVLSSAGDNRVQIPRYLESRTFSFWGLNEQNTEKGNVYNISLGLGQLRSCNGNLRNKRRYRFIEEN